MMITAVRPMAMAKKNNKRQKAVQERRSELKDIRTQLGEISKRERKRMAGLVGLHRDFLRRGGDDGEGEAPSSETQMVTPEVIPDATIDDYFEGQDN
jgi:hypothetical protein